MVKLKPATKSTSFQNLVFGPGKIDLSVKIMDESNTFTCADVVPDNQVSKNLDSKNLIVFSQITITLASLTNTTLITGKYTDLENGWTNTPPVSGPEIIVMGTALLNVMYALDDTNPNTALTLTTIRQKILNLFATTPHTYKTLEEIGMVSDLLVGVTHGKLSQVKAEEGSTINNIASKLLDAATNIDDTDGSVSSEDRMAITNRLLRLFLFFKRKFLTHFCAELIDQATQTVSKGDGAENLSPDKANEISVQQHSSSTKLIQNALLTASEGEEMTLTIGEITIQGKVGIAENPQCAGTAATVEWPQQVKDKLPSDQNINCLTSKYVSFQNFATYYLFMTDFLNIFSRMNPPVNPFLIFKNCHSLQYPVDPHPVDVV